MLEENTHAPSAGATHDDYRAQLAGKVLLAMERSSDSIEFVMSPRENLCAAGEVFDTECASHARPGEERADEGADGVLYDDGAQSHNLQLKRSRYDLTLDAECETIDPALAKYAEGEKSGEVLHVRDSTGEAVTSVQMGTRMMNSSEGVQMYFCQDTVRQVLDKTLQPADSLPTTARLGSACSTASMGRTASTTSSADSRAPLLQVGSVVVTKSQKVREIPVMGSECMRDESDQDNRWMWRGVRGKSFQSMLHSGPVPRLNLKSGAQDQETQNVNRIITFHDLFPTLNAETFNSPQNSRPSTGRPATRGLISRGKSLSQTPTVQKRLITTPRAQTARDSRASYDERLYMDVVKPMTARACKSLSAWEVPDVIESGGVQYLSGGVDRILRTPTYIGAMPLHRYITSRDAQRPQSVSREMSLQLFREDRCDMKGDSDRGSKAKRTSFVDAAPIGHGSSGLFSVITPRRQGRATLPKSKYGTMDRHTPQNEVVDGLRSMLLQRKLVCAPAINTRVRTSYYDELRRHKHKMQWSRYERECRDLWSVS